MALCFSSFFKTIYVSLTYIIKIDVDADTIHCYSYLYIFIKINIRKTFIYRYLRNILYLNM